MTSPSDSLEVQRNCRKGPFALSVPGTGQWTPQLAVSIVVPVSARQEVTEAFLEALAVQSYPGHLLEVVLVAEGRAPIVLAEGKLENCKMIGDQPVAGSRNEAFLIGVAAAEGDVVLRLDPNTIICREHVEAHMRWHHLGDNYLVVGLAPGDRVDGERQGPPPPDAASSSGLDGVADAEPAADDGATVVVRNTAALFAQDSWIYSVAEGATISWTPKLYRQAGEIDLVLSHGADLELCYRLAQAGGVIVREAEARSWRPTRAAVEAPSSVRYGEPALRHRLPVRRAWRAEPGRQWKTPYIDVVVEATDGSYEEVRSTICGALASTVPDVKVTLVGPWGALADAPPTPPDDRLLHLRLVREEFIHDGRVELREDIPATSAPVPFRFQCPAGLVPTPIAIERLVELIDRNGLGIVFLAFSHGSSLIVGRFERTEAVAQALAACGPGRDVVDVVDELHGSFWIDGSEWALVTAKKAPKAELPSELRSEIERWRTEALRRKSEAKRWKDEASRLKRELQAVSYARGAARSPGIAAKVARKGIAIVKRLAG